MADSVDKTVGEAKSDRLVSPEEAAELADKRVAFYQVSIESFLENRMERDKSLLTLSTAGVGVIITLWTTIGVATPWEFGLGIGAAVAFMIAIVLVLWTFTENANYLAALTTKQDFEKPNRKLRWLDRGLNWAFYIGLLLALAGALLLTTRKYFTTTNTGTGTSTEGVVMTDKSDKKPAEPQTVIGVPSGLPPTESVKPLNEGDKGFHSLKNFDKLAPNIDTGSLKNFHNLAPESPAAIQAPKSTTQAPQGTAQPGATNTSNTTKKP